MPFTLISKNVQLGVPHRLSPWRKVAMGTWKTVGDPSVYGILEVDAEPALAYLEKKSMESGEKLTLTHFIGATIGKTFALHPSLNCVLRWGRLYPRKSVDVFFQVASDTKGDDLSGTVIRNADKKSVVDIAREMNNKVKVIKTGVDKDYARMKGLMGILPGVVVGWVINFTGWILYGLNLWSPLFGAPKDSFGSIMITNIGSLGMDLAFAPLVPYSRVPVLIAMGKATEVPVVRHGKLAVGKRVKLCVTFDHRLIDGMHGSKMARAVERIFANPESELG
jgi:pyruvate/2-oxoglutarate dehydrogenase complex dihydrolipoamide acyltransferase (E2) component